MKKWSFILWYSLIVSCTQPPSDVVGEWMVHSKFYSATYKITEKKGTLNALVLYYNDGTSKYHHNGSKNYYAFTGLQKDGSFYIDGMTGATNKKAPKQQVEVQVKHKDTLQITTYVLNRPLREIWTRK